jgi:hypothetical protein
MARRLRLTALLALAAVTACLAAAPGTTAAPAAAGVTFELVKPTAATCKAPLVVLGSACADTRGMIVATSWAPKAGSADWIVSGRWEISYTWTAPEKVPSGGAPMTVGMKATELVGGQSDRICPAMAVTAGFSFKEAAAQPAGLSFCAEAGSTKEDSKKLTLVPSSAAAAGETYYLRVSLQDGPSYTYTYRSVAAPATQPGSQPKPGAGGGQGARRECTTIYAVVPSGAHIQANVKLGDLTPGARKLIIAKEDEDKYKGHPYTPIGAATQKQNCAGFVMQRLFGSKMVDANVDPDSFFHKVVKRYGTQRVSRFTAEAGDVVVYRDANGLVKHVAIVESNRGRVRILTKDGAERLYRATFPITPLSLTKDPLVQAHADGGTVEFWSVDRSKVGIKQVRSDCP